MFFNELFKGLAFALGTQRTRLWIDSRVEACLAKFIGVASKGIAYDPVLCVQYIVMFIFRAVLRCNGVARATFQSASVSLNPNLAAKRCTRVVCIGFWRFCPNAEKCSGFIRTNWTSIFFHFKIKKEKENESNFNFNSSKPLVRNNSGSLEHQVFVLT